MPDWLTTVVSISPLSIGIAVIIGALALKLISPADAWALLKSKIPFLGTAAQKAQRKARKRQLALVDSYLDVRAALETQGRTECCKALDDRVLPAIAASVPVPIDVEPKGGAA